MAEVCFAYYCSGHGYGHATRVSALACHLLKLDNHSVRIHIVSSAPQHVFADSISKGALYRFADIDPVIVQPLAYRVDRQKSVDALRDFLGKKESKLEIERQWLIDIKANCVLSDAAFLGCLAAKAAGLPSILITNFTFDSVYSYLSAPILDMSSTLAHLYPAPPIDGIFGHLLPDDPIPLSDLAPLVEEIHAGYRCADLLLLLPGCIPIPSFHRSPALPAQDWVDSQTHRFKPDIISHLTQSSLPSSNDLHPAVPFLNRSASDKNSGRCLERTVLRAPLLVRLPAAEPSVYTMAGRTRFLSSIGIPSEFHDPHRTRILVVSFGGQVFHRPPSRPPSRPGSGLGHRTTSREGSPGLESVKSTQTVEGLSIAPLALRMEKERSKLEMKATEQLDPTSIVSSVSSPRLATPSHLWFPGAPPVSRISNLPSPSQQNGLPEFSLTLPTPTPPIVDQHEDFFLSAAVNDDGPCLLPDSSWIAIVCGVSKEQWNELESDSAELPSGFFVAPRYVYMPDLMAVADVLLGKLGYGTVSECVDSCSPFVYVSRPLFIEEHGLRLLLEREGVGVELSRQSYEEGDWADAVQDAWAKGKKAKWEKRYEGAKGVGIMNRKGDGVQLAEGVVSWVQEWWSNR